MLSYAKILYALLRDRHEASVKNDWHDDNGEVYLYFKREEMQQMLHLSNKPVINAMTSLKSYGLLEEVKQGLGKPNKIYLLSVDSDDQETEIEKDNELSTDDIQSCSNDTCFCQEKSVANISEKV